MSAAPPPPPPFAPPDAVPVPPRRRGSGPGMAIAWVAIVLMVMAIVVGRSLVESAEAASGEGDVMVDRLFVMQVKLVAGALDQSSDAERRIAFQQLAPFDGGPVRRRQQFVVMAWELAGIEEARTRLEAIDELIDAGDAAPRVTDDDRAVQRALETLYGAGDEPAVAALTEADRELLVDRLDWIGRLALVPATGDPGPRAELLGPLQMVVFAIGILVVVGAIIACLGFVGLMLMLGFAFMGRLRSGLAAASDAGGVYVETFAVWLVGFFGLQLVAAVVAQLVAPDAQLLAAGIAFLVSLVVLAWPRLRGVPWAQVRADVGLHAGRGVVLEACCGVASYVMSLPIIAVGLAITLVLMWLAGLETGVGLGPGPAPEDAPAHPIVTQIVEGGWFLKAQVFFVASICAPLVEETFFRGFLYRHLREATRAWGTVSSILLGTAVNAFIFAVIHPQGMLAVPALMGIATGLTLAREWRGSLVPSMVMHGLSNGLAMTLLMVILGA